MNNPSGMEVVQCWGGPLDGQAYCMRPQDFPREVAMLVNGELRIGLYQPSKRPGWMVWRPSHD